MKARNIRRGLISAAAVAVASSLALAGCSAGGGGSAADGEPVTLEFWGWVPGLEDAVAAWNEDNPDIQIDFFRMTGDDGDKVPAAIDAGTAPDIVQMSTHSLPGHVINNRLTDLSEYVADIEGDFTESSWGNVTLGDGVYAVPQDSGPTGLLYRTDIFEQYGVDVPTTWDEYVEAGRALKAANPDVSIGQFSPNEAGLWIASIWQNNGTWASVDGDAWNVSVNGEESLEVAELWQTLVDEDLVKTVEMWTPEYWAEVNAGTIATINYGAWFPVLLEESAGGLAGNWAVAPTPNFEGSDAAGESGGGALVVPQGTEHVEQAVEFINWLNNSEEGVQFLIDGGVFPASSVGFENDTLLQESEYFGGQVVNEVFIEAAEKAPSSWTAGPTHDLTQNALKDAFARVANGEITFAEALDIVQEQTVAELTDMGLSVTE